MTLADYIESPAAVATEQPYGDRIVLRKIARFWLLLPYYRAWRHIIIMSILYNFLVQTYVLTFYSSFRGYFYSRMLMDILFSFDVILCILYKLLCFNIKKPFEPRGTHLIILDVITLISCDYVFDFGDEPRRNPFFVVMQVLLLLRIYRLWIYAVELSRKVGRSSFLKLLIRITVSSYIILHVCTCIWMMACGFADAPWTTGIKEKTLVLTRNSDEFILTMYFVTVLLNAIGYGDLNPVTATEYGMLIFMEFLGLVWLSVTIAMLVAHYEEKLNFEFEFNQRYDLIHRDLIEHETIPQNIVSKILDFYKCLWIYKSGSLESQLLETFPTNMRILVYVDQYWESIQRSSLLNNLDIQSKRALASKMRSQMHVEGDVIIKQGELRTFMMYIVQGYVKVLSPEDTESTVVLLTEGSLLCEASLMLCTPSPVQVEAGSLCELQILDRTELFVTATTYQDTYGIVFKAFQEIWEKSLKQKLKIGHQKSLAEAMHINEDFDVVPDKDVGFKSQMPYTWLLEDEMTHLYHRNIRKKTTTGIYVTLKPQAVISDDLCAYGKFPFSLQPDTSLLLLWDLVVFVAVFMCAIMYPTRAALYTYFTYYVILFVLEIVYVLDLFVCLMIAVEYKGHMLTSFTDIMWYRLTHTPTFVVIALDILCIFPLTMFYKGKSQYIKMALELNHLLKSWKLIRFFRTVEKKKFFHIGVVRITECVLCIFIISYWMGCFYYMQACFGGVCREGSFYTSVFESQMALGDRSERFKHKVEFLMTMGIGLISNSGYADSTPMNLIETVILLFSSVFSSLLLGYIVGSFAANLIITTSPEKAFIELVGITEIFMEKNDVKEEIQERVILYLRLQWEFGEGYTILNDRFLYFDTPPHLLYDMLAAARKEEVLTVPLLEETESSLVNYIANHADAYVLPPYESIVYAGAPCSAFYIVKDGFCIKYSGVTEDWECILGPKSNFCVMEMLFGIPATSEIRTATHVKMLRITRQQLENAWSHFPLTRNEIMGLVNEFVHVNALKKVIRRKKLKFEKIKQKQEVKSVIRFDRNSEEYQKHYKKHWDDVLKYVLMPLTIVPNGKFLKTWELIRIICVLLSSVFFPPYSYLWLTWPYLRIFRYVFDILTLADMYIGCHVGFYTKRGVLVTHPKATFIHYITHNFIIDLIAILPFDILSKQVEDEEMKGFYWQNTLGYFAFFPKLFLLYHLLSIGEYKELGKTKTYEIILEDILFMYCTMIIMNFSATILVIITTKLLYNRRGTDYKIVYSPKTWVFTKIFQYDFTQSILYVHLVALYWTVCLDFNVLFGDILPMSKIDMVYLISTFLCGYGIVAYIMVRSSSTMTGLGLYYTMYKANVNQLAEYLKRKSVNFQLSSDIIGYFTHFWNVTRTLDPHLIFSKFHETLQEDAMAYLYELTFNESLMFRKADFTFYRAISMLVKERYFEKESIVLHINDVVKDLFVIHEGEVTLATASDTHTIVLTKGGIFGNIDNSPGVRISYSVTTVTPIVLLQISNRKLYKLLVDYPDVEQYLKKLTADNTTYMRGRKLLSMQGKQIHRTDASSKQDHKVFKLSVIHRLTRENARRIYMYFYICLVGCAAFSCIVMTYHAAFQDHDPAVFAMEIASTLVFLGKLLWSLYMPPAEKNEETDDDRFLRKRYMKKLNGFWLDLFCSVPLYLFGLTAPPGSRAEVWSYLSLINAPRCYYLIQFYYTEIMELYINVMAVDLFKIIIMMAYSIHLSSCLLYIAACFKNNCPSDKWAYKPGKDEEEHGDVPNSVYLCSLYAATNIYSSTAIGTFTPDTMSETCTWILLIVVARFHVSILVGQISAVVFNYFLTRNTYNYKFKILMKYLNSCKLSVPLKSHIEVYAERLWQCGQYGLQAPILIDSMPSYLKSSLQKEIYDHHLLNNPVFSNCHPDFARQMMLHMKPKKFFAHNVIVESGTLNGTVYFIDEGEVQVFDVSTPRYSLIDVLVGGDTFGMIQCLYKMTPHLYSFRAIRDTIIVTLKYEDWSYLLPFFPETYKHIYERVHGYYFSNDFETI